MQTFKKILFATDFSSCADHAQAYACAFASRFKAEIHVVHAVDTTYASYAGVYGFGAPVEHHIAELKLQARHRLADVARLIRSTIPGEVHTHLVTGRAAECVADEANRLGCDLIITGTQGLGAVDHFLFGSTAERIVRYSDVPVLAVKPREREFVTEIGQFTLKHVLCPCDFSPLADDAVKFAVNICRIFGADLTLLHAIDPRTQYPFGADPALSSGEYIHKIAVERLGKMAARCKDTAVHIAVVTGIPDRAILDAARERNVDLIAMTTHGHGGLSRALLGSTAEKIARRAPIPVMTIRPARQNVPKVETSSAMAGTSTS